MGWVCEDGAHEGYLVAVVPDGKHTMGYRELGAVRDERGHAVDKPQRVWVLQVACDCGWRSARLSAPYQTEWAPSMVFLESNASAHAFEDAARELWTRHTVEIPNDSRLTLRPR